MDTVEFRDRIFDEIRMVNENLEALFRPVSEAHKLTLMQLRILMHVDRREKIAIGQLSRMVPMAATNLSTACRKLEQEGYIKRTRNQQDERIVWVDLTQKGKETILQMNQLFHEKYALHLAECPPEELDTIMAGLMHLNSLLEKMGS